jgi:dipeptidyl aminopeptidase/acylaminoacyl peptidase
VTSPRTHGWPAVAAKPRRKLWKRLAWILATALLVMVLATFGVSYYVGWSMTHPARLAVKGSPADYGMKYTDVTFPAREDHLNLKGWLIPADTATDKIVIFSHGYKGNRANIDAALPTMKALHDAGFTVLAFDYRDEGESDGSLVSVGFYEVRDLLGAVDWAAQHGYHKIGVIGYSMGASTALVAAAKDDRIQAVVADSPFANLHDYLEENLPVWSHLPNWPFTPEILWECRVFNGLDSRQVDPLSGLAAWKPRPLLLIAGTADDTIPMTNSQALYNVVKNNLDDQLWIVDGATHVKAYNVNPQVYETKVTSFFTRYLH